MNAKTAEASSPETNDKVKITVYMTTREIYSFFVDNHELALIEAVYITTNGYRHINGLETIFYPLALIARVKVNGVPAQTVGIRQRSVTVGASN